MINRLRDFWDNVRRIFFLIMLLFGIAILTITLVAPESIKQFVEGINVFLRLLFLGGLYGVFGFYAYRVLNGRQEEKGIDGLISRTGGKVTGISPDIAQVQIHKALHEVGGIKSLDVDVDERRGRVVVKASVILDQENANIIQKQNEIRRKLDHVVKKQLGLNYAEDPIIALNAQGGDTPAPKPIIAQQPVLPPPPSPVVVTDEADDNNPEWQVILKSAQPPTTDKSDDN
ncbi:MAG: hypothetical protein SH821_07655 [Phototrophicales bacterium]|nr:hypothetical protein [Phototrophicales bacterium]